MIKTGSQTSHFPQIKAVIFDCDGTLVDSEQFHCLAWQAAFEEQGYQLGKEFYIHHFSGLGDHEISKTAVRLLGFGCFDALLAHKNRCFDALLAAGICPITPTVTLVKCLFDQKEKLGLKLAVASGARKQEILCNLKNLAIDDCFDVILSGRDDLSDYQDPEGTNKPKPYVYLKAARLLGLQPQECVAIEDSRAGVSSAVEAGCFTIAIPNDYTRQQDLSQAHMKIASFADLDIDDFFKMVFADDRT